MSVHTDVHVKNTGRSTTLKVPHSWPPCFFVDWGCKQRANMQFSSDFFFKVIKHARLFHRGPGDKYKSQNVLWLIERHFFTVPFQPFDNLSQRNDDDKCVRPQYMGKVEPWCKACGEGELPSELQDLEDTIHHHQGLYEHITTAYSEVSRHTHRHTSAMYNPATIYPLVLKFCLFRQYKGNNTYREGHLFI